MADPNPLIYNLDDFPPWFLTLLYGLQWALIFFPSLMILAVIASEYVGLAGAEKVLFLQRVLITSGGVMILQTLWGHRYPLLDGPDDFDSGLRGGSSHDDRVSRSDRRRNLDPYPKSQPPERPGLSGCWPSAPDGSLGLHHSGGFFSGSSLLSPGFAEKWPCGRDRFGPCAGTRFVTRSGERNQKKIGGEPSSGKKPPFYGKRRPFFTSSVGSRG